MNIVLFTPALRSSAIGRMACLVVRELIQGGHRVVVVRSEDESLLLREAHPFGTELIPWNQDEDVETALANADAVIYQMGDHFGYHRGCLEWLPRRPGVVCLHDFYLGNLFFGWAQARLFEAQHVLRRWYGERAVRGFFVASATTSFIEKTCNVWPMLEWISSQAEGVITHSTWGIDRVLSSCPGPIRVVPLAYDAEQAAPAGSDDARDGYVRVLTVGHVNANKRAASVIRAIGSSELLRKRVSYQLMGFAPGETVHELAALSRNMGVRTRIFGEVSSETLDRGFGEADIACCLRWPSLEAASASTIEALLHGKAVIVTDTGFYRDLPDDCVMKIDPQNEIASLRTALERLADDADFRQTLGARGQTWAAATFTARNYADQVVAVAEAVARARPVLNAVSHLSDIYAAWGGDDALLAASLDPLRVFTPNR